MIDTIREQLLTVEEAATLRKVSTKTIRDWARPVDYRGRQKRKVLEMIRQGGRLLTSVEALSRFVEHLPTTVSVLQTNGDYATAIQQLNERFGMRLGAT